MTDLFYKFAFLDNENKVVNISVFDSNAPETQLLESIKQQFQAIQAISCTEYGEAFNDGYFLNGKFTEPKPYPSWILNQETYKWQSPIGDPIDGVEVIWDEENQLWKHVKPLEE